MSNTPTLLNKKILLSANGPTRSLGMKRKKKLKELKAH